MARARILLLKADGHTVDDMADEVGLNRKSVMPCVSEYREGGVENSLFDAPGCGRKAEFTDDERAWMVDLAAGGPSASAMPPHLEVRAAHVAHSRGRWSVGHTRWPNQHESTVHRILDEAEVKPFRIRHRCERRDPDFDEKTRNVLLVHEQLSMQFHEDGNLVLQDGGDAVHVLSYDEMPGIQAVVTTLYDLMADAGHGTRIQDYEYRTVGRCPCSRA